MSAALRPWHLTAILCGLGLAAASLPALTLAPAPAQAAPTESLQNPLTYDFMCSACHDYDNNAMAMGLPPHAPGAYLGTVMANAARDPVFWAGVALAYQDHPSETQDCVRCHSPRAFLEGRGDAIAVDELIPPDFNSVSCEVCHRAIDDGVTPAGNARYVLDDVLVDGEPPRRGPWAYADVNGPPAPPHPIIQDLDFLPSSRLCGTCHDVTTGRERLDDQGAPLGVMFNEQRTYSEWQNSAYAQPGDDARTCQDCHMALVEAPAAGCQEHENLGHFQAGARRHLVLGANGQILRIIAANSPGANGEAIDVVRAQLDDFLATAATLEVSFPDMVDLGAGVDDLPVRVTNETGHKLPTGYSEGRIMWLEVTARYAGELVWSSGLWDGLTIEADAQLRSYEGVAEQLLDGTRNHLLLNDHWILDTRIPPRGLTQDLETDPVGDRYAPLPDGTWPSYDDHSYQFTPAQVVDQTPEDPADDELELSVRLMYLINTQAYLDQLRDDNETNDAGAAVHAMFVDDGGPSPVVLAAQTVTVPLTGLELPEPGDGDGDPGDGDPGDGDPGDGDPGSSDTDGNGTGGTGETGPGATEDGQGCSCSAGGGEPGGPLGFGLALFALLGWRRRRNSSKMMASELMASGSMRASRLGLMLCCCALTLGCQREATCEHAAEATLAMFSASPDAPSYMTADYARLYSERFMAQCDELHLLELRCMKKIDELVAREQQLQADVAACVRDHADSDACIDEVHARAAETSSDCVGTFREISALASVEALSLSR